MGKTKVEFTCGEIATAIAVMASLNAERYAKPETRAMIYKCKAAQAKADAEGGVRVAIR